MNSKDYTENVLKTESNSFTDIINRFKDNNVAIRLIHASLGMNTEQAEFADVLKKYLFYGRDIDRVNLIEELGDQLWYIAIALDALLSDFDSCMEININKLNARYGNKFSNERANERNLDNERKTLEWEGKITTTRFQNEFREDFKQVNDAAYPRYILEKMLINKDISEHQFETMVKKVHTIK